MAKKKERGSSWLEAYKRVRKKMPPPTKVKPGKKGKGVPYKRDKEDWDAGDDRG
jgi:hypothetical protein